MAYTPEQIDWLWRNGKMPDWVYFQTNGKSAQENYVLATERAKQRILDNYNRQQEEARRKEDQKKQEAETQKQIEKQLETALEKALQDILGGFCK